MGNLFNNIRNIIQRSSMVNPNEPLRSDVLNARYQNLINERIYSYKDQMIEATRAQGNVGEAEINRMYSLTPEEFVKEIRDGFDESFENLIPQNQKDLMKSLGESTSYSGIYFGEIITGDKSNEVISMIQNLSNESKSDAVLLRKNNSAFLFAHGSQDGKIVYQGNVYSPQSLIQKMHDKNLIPDDIDNLFTMNCYGGKQQSFIGPGGVKVKSIHTSKAPILGFAFGGAALGHSDPMFMISLNGGDLIDEAKELLSKEGAFEVIRTADEIDRAMGLKKEKNIWGEPVIISHELVTPAKENVKKFTLDDGTKVTVEKISVDEIGDIDEYLKKEQDELQKRLREYSNKNGGIALQTTKSTNKSITKVPKKMSRKTLSGKGKLASAINIVNAAANIASAGASLNKTINKSSKNINKSSKKIKSAAKNIDNSYAQQMAADISSYRYGKHMTGFVNF